MSSYYEKILATGEVKCIDEEVPFEIPQGWEWCRLHDIIIFIGGYAYDSHSFLEKSEYQVLRLGNIKNDAINKSVNPVFIDEILAQNTVRFRCLKNDILVTMTGTRKKRDYFYTVLIDTDHSNMYFNQRVGCLRAIYSPIALWLNKVLKAESILHQVFQYETGTANQGNLGATNIMNTLIPLPPVTEQFRIVRRLEEVHTYVFQYDKAQHELDILNSDIKNTIKKSIVQEAIQGKLVPQIAEEGTAQELLEQIKTEKQKLVKEGKLKKSALNDSVIFRGDDNKYYEQIGKKCLDITEQIPFDLPESWSWARGMSVFMPMESTKPSSDFVYIDVDAVNNRLNIIDNPKKVRFENAPSRATRKLHKNDLLFSMVRPYLKNIALVDDIYIDAIASTGFYVITPSLGYYPMFLFYLMLSNYVVDGLNAFMKGDNSPSINNCHIEDYLYPLPPIEEQKRIVNKIKQLFKQLR